MAITKEEFVAAVTAQLWVYDDHVIDPRDLALLQEDQRRMFDEGWHVDEAAALQRCTEEVNPVISEERALARMSKIRASVMARLLQEQK